MNIELRPHHVLGYLGYIKNPKANHFAEFRKVKGYFHSDKLVKHWIKTIKNLHENPNLKFKYVPSMDTVCKECEHSKECHDPNHKYYKIVKDADQYAIKWMPELKFEKIYNGEFLRKLFEKKGWL